MKLDDAIKLAGYDYCEPEYNTVDELSQTFDDRRLGALAQIESMIQMILVNKELARAIFTNPDMQLEVLSNMAIALRKV